MPDYYSDQNNVLGSRPSEGASAPVARPVRGWVLLIVFLAWLGAIYAMIWVVSNRGGGAAG
ncbi:MAG: hypothetical protein HYU66_28465 [Armatimonadetes bacterium]|nr:hypothetical protein [Armatimonadota bacterium]